MKKKKLLIVFNNFGLGGIQKKILDLVEYLEKNKSKHNTDVYLLFREKSYLSFNFNSQLPANQIRKTFYYSDFQFPVRRFSFVFFFIQILRKVKPDSVLTFSQYLSPKIILLAKVFHPSCKVVVSQDNILSLENNIIGTSKHTNKIISFFYSLADKVICQTKFGKKDLVKNFSIDENKIVPIPNWKLNQREPLSNKKRPVDVVFLGRFAKQKNLSKFLKIALEVLEQKNILVKLYGSGSNQEVFDLLKKTKNHPQIEVHYPSLSPIEVLSKSKILLVTSLFEGHPMVIVEAMYAGCIPIAVQYPGVDEYIENGVSGFIVKNKHEAVKKILLLLNNHNLRKKISKQTHHFAKNFSENNIEKTLSEVL